MSAAPKIMAINNLDFGPQEKKKQTKSKFFFSPKGLNENIRPSGAFFLKKKEFIR
jgi:hypothetical protein